MPRGRKPRPLEAALLSKTTRPTCDLVDIPRIHPLGDAQRRGCVPRQGARRRPSWRSTLSSPPPVSHRPPARRWARLGRMTRIFTSEGVFPAPFGAAVRERPVVCVDGTSLECACKIPVKGQQKGRSTLAGSGHKVLGFRPELEALALYWSWAPSCWATSGNDQIPTGCWWQPKGRDAFVLVARGRFVVISDFARSG